jgi:hypothetical protein
MAPVRYNDWNLYDPFGFAASVCTGRVVCCRPFAFVRRFFMIIMHYTVFYATSPEFLSVLFPSPFGRRCLLPRQTQGIQPVLFLTGVGLDLVIRTPLEQACNLGR